MKIGFWHNLPSGGAKRALYNHVKGLVRLGHQVDVWSPPPLDDYLPLDRLARVHHADLNYKDVAAVSFTGKVEKQLRIGPNIRAMEDHCRRCADQINRAGVDVLVDHGCCYVKIPPIAQHVAAPVVLYMHEPTRRLYEASPRLPWMALPDATSIIGLPAHALAMFDDHMKMRYNRVLVREEYRNISAHDLVLVNSLFCRESVLRSYGVDATVSYLGIDCDVFYPERTRRAHIVISVGALVPEKNPLFIMRAMARLRRPRPRLVWVANRVDRQCQQEVEAFGCENGVPLEIRCGIDDGELRMLYNTAKVFAYAPRLEPFGLAPLEASACGTPVVAVAEGGVRETVSDGVNGFLVENDPGAMASAIESILADPGSARALSRRAIACVRERWSLDASIDAFERRLQQATACR